MRGFDLDWYDFTQMLSAAPGTRKEVRDLLQQGYDIKLPKTSYEVMWDRLSEQLGEEGAVNAVCELVIATAPPRLFDLIDELWKTGSASIRSNDSQLVHLMFESPEAISELGACLANYYLDRMGGDPQETDTPVAPDPKGPSEVSDAGFLVRPKSESTEAVLTDIRLTDLVDSLDRPLPVSAQRGGGLRLERVRASRSTKLRAKDDWKESDLEQFLMDRWSDVDFGLDAPLTLVGRQVRLQATGEKVDLLATQPDGTWIVIELKIVPAHGGDLTQLQSYLQDLEFNKVAPDKIRGLLVAPDFSDKILNAAAGDHRVILMRFSKE